MVSVEPPEMNAAARCKLERRAEKRQRIDAVMRAETFVLIGEQHVEEPRIDIGDPRRQPPAAFAGGIGAQQAAVAIDHAGREFDVLAERRRPERSDPPCATPANAAGANQRCGED